MYVMKHHLKLGQRLGKTVDQHSLTIHIERSSLNSAVITLSAIGQEQEAQTVWNG